MERRKLKALVVIQPFSSITGWAYHNETGSYLECAPAPSLRCQALL